jgi:DNA polymerase
MRVIGLDFESFYDQDYSLSSKKMTTEQYIRDPRFEIIGVSIKRDRKTPAVWFSGTHKEVLDFLDAEINWDEDAVLAHHAAFDGAILSWVLDRRPKVWIDTLSMARPKHLKTTGVSLAALAKHYKLGYKGHEVVLAKGKRRKDFTVKELADYGAYCCNDIELTYELFYEFAKSTSTLEMRVIDHTIRMFTEPKFRLNQQVLEAYHKEVVDNKEKLITNAKQANRDPFMSSELFAELLRANGVEPPTKWSEKQKKLVFAFAKTDKGMKDLLAHDDPAVQALAACRLGVKTTIEETRAQRFVDISKRGMLPIMLNYWGAGTGRFSGGDKINPQNLKRGGTLRYALEAPVGFQVISSDLSQIEARILALVAEQDDLVQDFFNKMDVYSLFASEVYGRTITKADEMERFVGKTCILGLGYYTGAAKLRETLRIGNGGISVVVDEAEATRIVKLWRKKNNKIVNFWKNCGLALDNMVIGGSGYVSQKFNITYSGEEVTLPNGAILSGPWCNR